MLESTIEDRKSDVSLIEESIINHLCSLPLSYWTYVEEVQYFRFTDQSDVIYRIQLSGDNVYKLTIIIESLVENGQPEVITIAANNNLQMYANKLVNYLHENLMQLRKSKLSKINQNLDLLRMKMGLKKIEIL